MTRGDRPFTVRTKANVGGPEANVAGDRWQAREALARVLDELSSQLDVAERYLSEQRYTSGSGVGLSTAIVDGNGALISLDIPDSALRQAYPERLGSDVVEAVNEARTAAAQARSELVTRLLGGQR